MKKVYLRGRAKAMPSHSPYRELTEFPPEGYQLVGGNPELADRQRLVVNLNKRLESIPTAMDVWRELKTLRYMTIRSTQAIRSQVKGQF